MQSGILHVVVMSIICTTCTMAFAEQSNANLYVSAENALFDNNFAGPMVVEVVVRDGQIRNIYDAVAEPAVSVDGRDLRMVQASDGNWYAYFADVDAARAADALSRIPGTGLDFGMFCGSQTDASVLGIDISETSGVSVPRAGLAGSSNGLDGLESCSGTLESGESINNVVRKPDTINTSTRHGSVGQIGLFSDAWPLVQLFRLGDSVEIKYERGDGTQKVLLHYDGNVPNIPIDIDRQRYPRGAEVILNLYDVQLNQDPTDWDSWTFGTGSTFYRAFDDRGNSEANGGAGLVNLAPHLSNLGFDENGAIMLDTGSVIRLQTNAWHPTTSVTDGADAYSDTITLLESRPNSGEFHSYDHTGRSVLGIRSDAPRDASGILEYNGDKTSILAGPVSALLSLEVGRPLLPGRIIPLQVIDQDQNVDSTRRDMLDVSNAVHTIPSLQIGRPITLEHASDVQFYPRGVLGQDSVRASSSVPDRNSDRLLVSGLPDSFRAMSVDLGVSAAQIGRILLDTNNANIRGTNWMNLDMRSLERNISSVSLYFGLDDTSPVQLSGITPDSGMVRINDADTTAISSKSGDAFLVVEFDSATSSQIDRRVPVVFDLFSFGRDGDDDVNNAIYRFELEETTPSSGTFRGTMEYAITNQVNLDDPGLINSLRPSGEDVRFLVSDRLVDNDGITINYRDLTEVGVLEQVSVMSDIRMHSGTVGFGSTSYGLGRAVTVWLNDPDLNLNPDLIDTYRVVNDPASLFVDRVGTSTGWLLEIRFKDSPYKRCVTNTGEQISGLASTGFSLIETARDSGAFEGTFKVPNRLCNADGTGTISPAGGAISARYNDFRDEHGNNVIVETGRERTTGQSAKPDQEFVSIPSATQAWWVGENAMRWAFGQISASEFANIVKQMANSGVIDATVHDGSPSVPAWTKIPAKWLHEDLITYDEFLNMLRFLVDRGVIRA